MSGRTAFGILLLTMAGSGWGCAEDSQDRRADSVERSAEASPAHSSETDTDAKGERSEREEELARIERAKPEAKRRPETPEELSERIRNAKKVRYGRGWTWIPGNAQPPNRTATAAVPGCDTRTSRHATSKDTVRIPQPPGVTAKRVAPTRILVTYRIGGDNAGCRARWLRLKADTSRNRYGGIGKGFPIRQRSGQVILRLTEESANADVLTASTMTKDRSGLSSRNTTIRVR
jgi:hypothetical protein